MRSEKCCTSVILLHQKPNPPHLCLHPTFAFQKGAAGMPFLHIYIWLKAVNEHVMKIIMADLRLILYFEIISDSLVTAVLTWQQMNRVLFYILCFSYSFKSTNRLIMCFSRLVWNWLQMIWESIIFHGVFIADTLIQLSWPSFTGPIIMYFLHTQPIIWNKGGLERTASLKQSHILAF